MHPHPGLDPPASAGHPPAGTPALDFAATTMQRRDATDPAMVEAADWLLCLNAAPGDLSLETAFRAWLDADRHHAEAWDGARRTWRLLGRTRRAAPDPAARPRGRRRIALAAAVALAACLALVAALPPARVLMQADHATATGAIERVTLADGTVVHLNTASAVDVRYAAGRREVVLLAGEAFFEVARDPLRPFTVVAGDLEVTALGTAFDVRRAPESFAVWVEHGTVAVRFGRGEGAEALRLAAGEGVAVDRASGTLRARHASADQAGGWRSGHLFANGATIAEVVAALRPYHPGAIVITDAALGAHRVTGAYDLRHPDRAVRALVEPFAGRVRALTPFLLVVSPR